MTIKEAQEKIQAIFAQLHDEHGVTAVCFIVGEEKILYSNELGCARCILDEIYENNMQDFKHLDDPDSKPKFKVH